MPTRFTHVDLSGLPDGYSVRDLIRDRDAARTAEERAAGPLQFTRETLAKRLRDGLPASLPPALAYKLRGMDDQGEGTAPEGDEPTEAPRRANGHAASLEERAEAEQLGENPKPLDIFTKAPLPTLRPEWLPGPLADYVFDQSDIIGSDPGILAISAIVACASCIHDGHMLQPRRHDPTWKESARLWGAFVGEPSVKKTPPLKRAVSHLKAIDLKLGEESRGALYRHKVDAALHAKLEKEYVRKGGTGERPGDAPEKPPERRLLAEDTTVEKLGVMLADNPRGMLILHDELSGFFGGLDAYRENKGKDKAAYLELYNGGPRRIDRIGRESLLVRNWSACMLGGIQPAAMRKIASKLEDDGLLQRFMVVMASEADGIGDDRAPDREALDGYRGLLDQLFATEPAGQVIRMDDAAIDIREQLEHVWKQSRKLEVVPLRMRYALGKWDGLWCRLALAYHCIESAYLHKHPASRQVSAETATRVSIFMREYLFRHMLAFYTDVLEGTDYAEHARWVGCYILAHKKDLVRARDIHRAFRRWRGMKEWEQANIMRQLEESGWVFPEQPEYGRRVTEWRVNFRVHEEFKDRAERERTRRAEIHKLTAELVGQ